MCEFREKLLYIRSSLAAGSPSRGKQVLNNLVELLTFLEFVMSWVYSMSVHTQEHCGLSAKLMYSAVVLLKDPSDEALPTPKYATTAGLA